MDNNFHKLIVRNSGIIINDYNRGECPHLEYNFQLQDRVTREIYDKAIYFDDENKRVLLPRGMDIPYLEEKFNARAYVDKDYNKYDYLDNQKIRFGPRDDRQQEVLKFMLGKEGYLNNQYASQLSVNCSPGFGKTFLSVFCMIYFNMKSAVITSSVNWLNQWKKKIMEYTDIKPNEIYLISGSATISKILASKKKRNRYKIYLVSDATLNSYASRYGWEAVDQLFKILRIGLKFYDEAHLHFDNMCMIDFYTNVYKTYYLTATPARSDTDEDKIYQLYFKNIPSIDMFEEELDRHTNYLAIKFNSHPTALEISRCKNIYGLNRNIYIDYLIQREVYYDVMMIVLDMALRRKGRVLVYIGINKAIEITKEWIELNFPELKGHIGIYTSIIKENKKQQLNNKIILTTIKSCGAAMDIKGLGTTIVLADPFKSKVTSKQSLGRTRDMDTWYIDLVDIGFYSLNKWYYKKRPTFAKYALSMNEIMLTDKDIEDRLGKILLYIKQERDLRTPPLLNYNPEPIPLLDYSTELKPLLTYVNSPFSKYIL